MLKRAVSSMKALFSNVSAAIGAWWGQGYNATDPRRKIIDIQNLLRANRITANELLSGSLPLLRGHCRHLERNNPTARAAIEGLAALIVGTGIALEPVSEQENVRLKVRDRWKRWIRNCGIHGECLDELQTLAIREVVTAGEALFRIVILPELAEKGEIPIKLVPLEAEWLIDHVPMPGEGLTSVSGIELDKLGRPVRYHLRNPYYGGQPEVEIVDAKWIIHIFERRRAMQNRGEPWFAPVIETLMNERDLVDVELYASKQSAAPAIVIKSPFQEAVDVSNAGTPEDPVHNFKLGGLFRLYPGEELQAHSHTRPSQQIAPFRQMLRGDIASSMRLGQRFLDRDVRGANYSSMKADQIDSGMLLGPVREWLGHQTAGEIYRRVLPWLELAEGLPPQDVDYRLIPDEIPYLDPQKDIGGAIMAIAAGLSNWEKEIGRRGGDAKEVLEILKKELADPMLATVFQANLPRPPAGEPDGDKADKEKSDAGE